MRRIGIIWLALLVLPFFSRTEYVSLIASVVHAQVKPESYNDQTDKRTWQRREAQTKALKKALAQNPKSAEAHYALGMAYLSDPVLGATEAIRYFQQAVVLKPNYAEAYLGLGDAYVDAGQFDSEWKNIHNAVEAYRKAISIRPDFAEAYVALGWAYVHEGDAYKLAADAFKEAIRIKPNNAEPYSGLATTFQNLDLPDDAIAAYKQAIKLKANSEDRMIDLIGLQSIYMKLTKSGAHLDEYIDVVKQMIEINSNSPHSYFTLGDLYVKTGRAEEAIEAYTKGISVKPTANPLLPKLVGFETGRQKLGEVYIKLGRYTEAIEACKQAIQENSKNGEAYRVLSNAYLKAGLAKEAIEAGEQAVRILPDDPQVYYNLGQTYVAVGDKESATAQYNALIKMAESGSGTQRTRAAKSGSADRVGNATELLFEMQKASVKHYADMLLERIKQL